MNAVTRSGLALLAAILLTCGCVSRAPAPDVYRLVIAPATERVALAGFTLVVGPVTIPERLKRPGIQHALNATRLTGSDNRRWSEPLDDALAQELAWYLGSRAPGLQVFAYPGPDGIAPGYLVELQLSRFEATTPTSVELAGNLVITTPRSKEPLATRRFSFSEPLTGNDDAALVAAHGRAGARLGELILELLEEST